MNEKYVFWKSSVFIIILILIKISSQLSCLDENGSRVDWFIVYKMPKLETTSNDNLKSGYGYVYITDKSYNNWTLSDRRINKKDSIFGQTITSVIDSKTSADLSYVVYNDDTPDSKDSDSLAHAKGLFAINAKGGFWLSHSVPKFPALERVYKFPETAKRNGQTAICISIDMADTSSLKGIASHLLMMRPNIYGIRIENNLSDKSYQFLGLMQKDWTECRTHIENKIFSRKRMEFMAFSKSQDFNDDLYSGILGPYFKKQFLVQSWRNGAGGKLDSDCNGSYQVQNVERIAMPIMGTVDWEYTEDHSKWAITSGTTGKSYTCIADINRVKSQFKRGGGSLCLDSKRVWKLFKKSVEEVEGCSTKKSGQ